MVPRYLYLHVPFCLRRCSYCDFAVEATREVPTEAWLEAIDAEWRMLALEREWTETLALETIYVGGGTPSLLARGAMRELAKILSHNAEWSPAGLEWTAEANPESFTLEVARDWRAAGINRISLGAQTFDDSVLRWMGRLHGPDGPARAVDAARAAGFDNLSIDLIFGVPERFGRDWESDLERVLALAPEHVSLYGLTAEAATPLGRWVGAGRERLAGEDLYAEEYLLAHRMLTDAGYEHYEVSNFGLPGRASRHNLAYWAGVPYAALGPGAHAFYPPVRRWNLRGWGAYQEALQAGRLPVENEERNSEFDARLEKAWLDLRTSRGTPLIETNDAQRELARLWDIRGWAARSEGRLRLTAAGWLLLDRLAVDFASAGEYPDPSDRAGLGESSTAAD